MKRKGIIMCAGNGTRLKPLTTIISKHLLQVYDKPMIYYPLSVLMISDIKEYLFITNSNQIDQYKALFGNGSSLGIHIEYAIQEDNIGIAQGLIIAEDFLEESPSVVILGDNLLYGNTLEKNLLNINIGEEGACIFLQKVRDPERFCVAIFDENNKIIDLIEKPNQKISDLAVIGLYYYDKNAPKYAKELEKSKRGELEITDLNKIYLDMGNLKYDILGRGFTWLDMGTFQTLFEAQSFINVLQHKQGYKIACLEEISLYKKWIKKEKLLQKINEYNNEYGEYLKRILERF
tara:strand:- start:107 stop:979 length:873 start_codon:yes stop_codon:yes gene_type:complete